jgi:predicted RNA binding protein YcfA (HicA-like mRNA interferase family)
MRIPTPSIWVDYQMDKVPGRLPPKKVLTDLEKAGFINRGGKGSHRNFTHPSCIMPVTISGKPGSDAKPYQERAVRESIEESKR